MSEDEDDLLDNLDVKDKYTKTSEEIAEVEKIMQEKNCDRETAYRIHKNREEEQERKKILDGQKEQDEEPKIIKTFPLDPDKRVILLKNGIVLEKRSGDHWSRQKIFSGKIEPIEKMNIDGNIVFKYKMDVEKVDSMINIIKKLKAEGGVLCKNKIDDVVNTVFLGLPEVKGHATIGVYEDGDNLELYLDDVKPYKDLQKQIHERCKPSFKQKLDKDSLKPYFDVIENWHLYEVLPSMGLSIMAPFGLMLRKHNKIVPNISHYSPISGLGKSTVQKIFSYYLFLIYPESGDAINSPYRLVSLLDSICCFICVEEVDNVDFSQLESILKYSPENYKGSSRGRPDLTSDESLSRATLGMTSNRFKIQNETTLVRILKIEFDSTAKSERARNKEKVEKLTRVLNELKPIGWELVRLELELVGHSMEPLLEKINGHEKELRKRYNFFDPRRSTEWAIVYEGLQVWEFASSMYDLDWKAPSYEIFVKEVVDKIEKSTKETGEAPIEDFLCWWSMWQVNHKITNKTYNENLDRSKPIEIVKGEGEIFAKNKTIVHGGKVYDGFIITSPVLREYKLQKNSKIDNLGDIAKAVENITGIPKDKSLKIWNIGKDTKQAVFIPNDIWKYNEINSELGSES